MIIHKLATVATRYNSDGLAKSDLVDVFECSVCGMRSLNQGIVELCESNHHLKDQPVQGACETSDDPDQTVPADEKIDAAEYKWGNR